MPWGIALVMAALLAAAVPADVQRWWGQGARPLARVPDLRGETPADAARLLAMAGLRPGMVAAHARVTDWGEAERVIVYGPGGWAGRGRRVALPFTRYESGLAFLGTPAYGTAVVYAGGSHELQTRAGNRFFPQPRE